MAPLPPSNTKRYFLDYQVAGEQHTMTMRVDDAATDEDASTGFDALLTAMAPLLLNIVVVRMRVANSGTNVTTPATYGGALEFGTGAGSGVNVPDFWSFTGKDSAGRIVKVEIFGRSISPNNNFRVNMVDDSDVEAALSALDTVAPIWLTISGSAPFWNPYANQGVNAYWQRQARL